MPLAMNCACIAWSVARGGFAPMNSLRAAFQALLPHVDALAAFLGRRECVDFLMPAIVTFLNDRSGWQLRAALFAHIGSIATEARLLCCVTTFNDLCLLEASQVMQACAMF